MAKLTKNQRLWIEQTGTILTRIQRLQNQGVDTTKIPRPPTRPKTITAKQFQGLKSIEEEISKLETSLQEDKDKTVKVKRQQNIDNDNIKLSKIAGAEIATGHHSILYELYLGIDQMIDQALTSNGLGSHLLRDFVNMMVENYGLVTTGALFYNASKEGYTLTNEILYDSDGTKATPFISQISRFLTDKEDYDIFKDKIHEIFEYYDRLEFADFS